MSAEIEAVLAKAQGQVGVREATGHNDGPEVERYLSSVGLGAGNPWCAAFVKWCLSEALPESTLGHVWYPDNPAYCPSIYTWARQHGIVRTSPARGDVFLYMENGWALHTGFVTGAAGGRFSTIEGNTNPLGGAEGDGVYERSRPDNGVYVFVRWGDLLPQEGPTPTYALVVKGSKVCDMPLSGGRAYVSLRAFAGALGLSLSWDADAHKPRLGGKLVSGDVTYRTGLAWAQVHDLLISTATPYTVDTASRSVVVS